MNSAPKYPVGIQSFSKLIEEGYIYVDKTGFIAPLVRDGGYYFLSRPRRFGKSLLLSTLQAYFEGRRELFRGLAIDSADLDWTPSPVLHFDLNAGLYDSPVGLEERLSATLTHYENEYGIMWSGSNVSTRFETLIRKAYELTSRKVVILVDEYDKPLLGIEENPVLFERNQSLLKGFFSNLKSMDQYIRFAFMTGVARFNKVSVFSDLNNLDDISLSNRYADICGWTEAELVNNFRQGLEVLASEREEDPATTLKMLRDFYDGYLFAPKGSRLYNPFSVLLALRSREIEPYWFETGTPTFLARRVKSSGMDPASINGQICTKEDLMAVGIGMDNSVPLMFKTGYLTIGSYDPVSGLYELRFPNREVEVGFSKFLLPMYAPAVSSSGSQFGFSLFRRDLYAGHPDEFMSRLATLLKDLPGEDHRESTYRAIVYLLCVLSGTDAHAERHGYKGRSDLEVSTPGYVYVFEFKYNRNVAEAMSQIIDRDYAGRYGMDGRSVYLIGANFTDNGPDRGLSYEIEQLR